MRHIVQMLLAVPTLATSLGVAACSSNYHPEYHPVTVSNFSQNLSYPVAVNTGDGTVSRAPVYVLPTPQTTVTAPALVAPPSEPPPDFFH